MKAMLLRGPNTPFEPVQLPDPTPGPGEAVARVITCGSGLTIQHVKAGRRKTSFPRVLGHEITAEIVAVGAGVTSLKIGDGVTAYYYLNCGHCRHCLANLEPLCTADGGNVGIECDGGYADYIKLPAHIFVKYPDALDWRAHPAEAGVITDALATPYKVLRRAGIHGGETVAVIGAGGGVGIHQVMMAAWANARVIAVEVAADKFDACRKAGADEVVDYVCTAATLEAGAKALGRRGRLVILGGAAQAFNVAGRAMLLAEQSILGSRYVTRSEILETCDLVARSAVRPLVTELRPLADAELIHDRVEKGLVTGRAALQVG
jgi:D-arabinose 1-dehydrogenase-like Zn-dependent alcohol dehydrogenase